MAGMFDWFKKRRTDAGRSAQGVAAPNGSADQATPLENSVAHKKKGDAYFGQGKFSEASACYQEAIRCNPNYAEAYSNWGNVCREQNLPDDAERFLRKAATLKPELANVHYNLASLLFERGNLEEAIKHFAKEVEHQSKHYAALAILLHLLQRTCRWDDLEAYTEILRRAVYTAAEAPESVFSPFVFIALPGTTAEEQKCCAERWARAEYQGFIDFRHTLSFQHKRHRGKKIAIGYLSADFRDHPVARLIARVIALHDRDQFHITAYSYGPEDGSEMRDRLQKAFDRFVDIRGHSDVDAAMQIYKDGIDILVDLTGYTKDSRNGILALRPAPVQVNYLGYAGTIGAPFMDCIITDRFATPPEAQVHFSERFVYLPHSFLPYDQEQDVDENAPERRLCGLPDQGFVFCCFNQTYKLTPQFFALWMRLLHAIPGSVLWLSNCSPAAMANLRREASLQDMDPARVVFAPRTDTIAEHLARHRHADLFLDTSPYNAHTTCSDALWMGVPVVTCAGETFPSRVAGSLLSAIGMSELITDNPDDYYRLALDLATDRKKLEAVRSKLVANRDTAPLFDSILFTRNLEHAYAGLVENHPADATSH
jgi:protein O-GlcNAc transferase